MIQVTKISGDKPYTFSTIYKFSY